MNLSPYLNRSTFKLDIIKSLNEVVISYLYIKMIGYQNHPVLVTLI